MGDVNSLLVYCALCRQHVGFLAYHGSSILQRRQVFGNQTRLWSSQTQSWWDLWCKLWWGNDQKTTGWHGRKERKETVPTRTFLQWFVEHMGNGDNKVRSPQGIMEAFVYECMADDQEKLTNDGFADDFFVHLMEYKYIRRYFSPIIPRIREIINLTACNLCDSPGTSQTSVNQISLHYLTE